MAEWNYWSERDYYQKELSERAKGIKEEMEAAKHISNLIRNKSKAQNSILDAGSGPGHFIISLQKKLKKDFKYLGVDITKEHVSDGNKIFDKNPNYNFIYGDVRKLPVKDNMYDISLCSNTIPHIPNVCKAISELVRVSKNDVFIRMLVGNEILITKKALTKTLDENCELTSFMYVNIYTEDFIKKVVGNKGSVIIYEDSFNAEKIEQHYKEQSKIAGKNIATRIINGIQFKGHLMLPWKIVHIKKY